MRTLIHYYYKNTFKSVVIKMCPQQNISAIVQLVEKGLHLHYLDLRNDHINVPE